MSAIRGVLAAATLMGLLWLAPTAEVLAACASPNIGADLARAPTVFVGVVTSVGGPGGSDSMHVIEIWKGTNLPDPVTIYPIGNPSLDGPPDPGLALGTKYLMLPQVDEDGTLRVGSCSGASIYAGEFDALRPANAHPPQGPPTSGVPGSPPIAAIFLAILVLGSVGAFILFRSGRNRIS